MRLVGLFILWYLVFLYTLSQEETMFVYYLLRHHDNNHKCLPEDRDSWFRLPALLALSRLCPL